MRWGRPTWQATVGLGAGGVLVAVTAWLATQYLPSAAQAWGDVYDLATGESVDLDSSQQLLARFHQPLVLACAALVVTATIVARRRGESSFSWALPAGAAVGGLTAALTAPLLAWDQLALWAVTADTDGGGWWVATGDSVRFVLLDGAEVTPGDYRATLYVHLAGVGLVGAAALCRAVASARVRSSDLDAASAADESSDTPEAAAVANR